MSKPNYYAYTDDLNLLTFTAQSPTGSRLWSDARKAVICCSIPTGIVPMPIGRSRS